MRGAGSRSLLFLTREEPTPKAAFTGEGSLTISPRAVTTSVMFTGDGSLAVRRDNVTPGGTIAFSGDSALDVTGERLIVAEMALSVLDPSLTRAPTALTVMVVEGWPNEGVDFDIDGTVIYSDTLDSGGNLGPISLAVDEALGTAGSHTITVTSTGTSAAQAASSTFTIGYAPAASPRTVGSDAPPVDVPASHTATGVRRWVLQDLMPGGLGSWVMPANPSSMSPPPFQRALGQAHTTAINGKFHFTEAGIEAHPWSFAGYLSTKEEHDQLLAYGQLKRRFYVIDHRGRAWITVINSVELVPRRRIANSDGTFNDWAHDYTVNAVIHGDEWKVPL